MKRALSEIDTDLDALDAEQRELKRQRRELTDEWYDHPDTLRASLPPVLVERFLDSDRLTRYHWKYKEYTSLESTVDDLLAWESTWLCDMTLDGISYRFMATETAEGWEWDEFEPLGEGVFYESDATAELLFQHSLACNNNEEMEALVGLTFAFWRQTVGSNYLERCLSHLPIELEEWRQL